jgi:hypothetical protein
MPYVGYTGVANQANTSDGFASEANAQNPPTLTNQWGLYVGDTGVVDLYHNGTPPVTFYILMESTGYVLQEDSYKIVLESS